MELTRRDFSQGWRPGDDDVNGVENALLRADNLITDETNAIVLTRPYKNVGSELSSYVHTLYSEMFGSTKIRFAATGDGRVLAGTTDLAELFGGGNPVIASFASTYGHVLISSGYSNLKKYNGSTLRDVGLDRPAAPAVTSDVGPYLNITDNWTDAEIVTGTDTGDDFETASNFLTLTLDRVRNAQDWGDDQYGRPTDTISFTCRYENTSYLKRTRIIFALDSIPDPKDYYYTEWVNEEDGPYNQGLDAISVLERQRSEFTRVGNSELDWKDIKGVRLEVEVTTDIHILPDRIDFFGSSKGSLSGPYEYIQVNVFLNDGAYETKSSASPISNVATPARGRVIVTPSAPVGDWDQIWLYRRSADPVKDLTRIGEPRKLSRFYRVAVLDSASEYTDILSDEEALLEGTTIDFRMASMKARTDEILGIATNINTRAAYLTIYSLILSSPQDPDSYNPLHEVRFSGNQNAKNLWVLKYGQALYVGTTEDIYEVQGSMEERPDGTLNMSVRGLGIKQPPISRNVAVVDGSIMYYASDGPRSVSGQGSVRVSTGIDLLLKEARYGFPQISIYPNGLVDYPIVEHLNRLWMAVPCVDGSRRVLCLENGTGRWSARNFEALCLFVEPDGKLLGGFGGGSGNWVRELDVEDEEATQSIHLLTKYYDNNQPRNRKDTFTLKVQMDTGGVAVQLYMGKDGLGLVPLGSFATIGYQEVMVEVNGLVNLGKRFAFQIIGNGLKQFRLSHFTLEYDARPEQVNYLRIPSTNMNSLARKRWTSYAFVIDTLGNDVNFVPYVDNVAKTATLVNKADKLTHVHYFTSDTVGTDIAGILYSAPDYPFEFYGLNLDETVSEKLPTPTCFLLIPQDDYGQPNRKRHSSYKFKINTRGSSVRFTPRIDGVDYAPLDFSTTEKRTVEYFFTTDTSGIDIGGRLESLASPCVPFEYYGNIIPQHIEVFPPRLREFRIPETNYGVAARKRIRTMPMEINTNGSPVTFTPFVDGLAQPSTTIVTTTRATAFHYFNYDSFGIDYSAELTSEDPFEFYGLLKPEDVQVLPVAKVFDQLGPITFHRQAKLSALRLRCIFTHQGTVPIKVYADEALAYTAYIPALANQDRIYELMKFPKTIRGSHFRVEIGPTPNPFHRYQLEYSYIESGKDDEQNWVVLK